MFLARHVHPVQHGEAVGLDYVGEPSAVQVVPVPNHILSFPSSSTFFTQLDFFFFFLDNRLDCLTACHYLERFHGRPVIRHDLFAGREKRQD